MDDVTVYVSMPDAPLPTAVPGGWNVIHERAPLVVLGPESDVKMSFLAYDDSGRAEQLFRAAWRDAEPGFDLPVRQKVEMPGTGGWDKVTQVTYDTPESESRLALAIARMLGSRAYVTLIDGTKAGFSRRSAQVAELHNGWKPEGLKEPSLVGISPRTFGEEEQRAMKDFVAWSTQWFDVPGVSLAVVQNGRTVFAEGFGVRRAGGGDPVEPTTRFMIGSSTKPLTTLMMARLVDSGHFTWTTPVTEVLPGFALADSDVTQRLEMRHTVCACTGMPRRDFDLVFRFRGVRPEDRIAEMKGMSPTTGFGETFQYSNYLVAAGGYAAAHSYVPDVTLGEAYERSMQQLVFEPLRMQQSSVRPIDSPLDAAPHARDLEGNSVPIDPVLEQFADATAPAGSVWSTVLDMARYISCELRNGLNEDQQQIVSTENLLARRRSAVKIDGKTSYGLGLIITEQQGLAELKHGGNMRGFTSEMLFLPDHGVGLVVLTNLGLANLFLAAVEQKFVEILFGAESKADAMVRAAKKANDDSLASTRERVKTDPASIEWIGKFTGGYVSNELGLATIVQVGDKFRFETEAWSSDLGSEEQPDNSRQIVFTSPAWRGIKLQLTDDPSTLLLDGGQTRYLFVRDEHKGA